MDTQSSPWAVYPGDLNHLIKEGPAFINRMVWSQYTGTDDVLRITDRDGRDVFAQRANLNFEPVDIEMKGVPFWDLFVTQFDSGELHIYIR